MNQLSLHIMSINGSSFSGEPCGLSFEPAMQKYFGDMEV